MSRRRSIYLDGLSHGANPIPLASVIDGHVYSGGVIGRDPVTGALAAEAAGQIRQMFANVEAILAAAGGSLSDVAKVDVVLADLADRVALNVEWERLFPDIADRPARKTDSLPLLPKDVLVQCQFVALLAPHDGS